jgi:hypothetical protein
MECLIQHGCQDVTATLNIDNDGDPVARGGFGAIYLGTQHDGTQVAIKCIETFSANDNHKILKVRKA